ncbi:hypothetical protein [Streptomyces sp. NPDC048603]|uniref:hypothetical protein n=1 Tax=Streptomyces sp. NPDC048603 TaxID=3365577 RepID=UPI00371D919F
MTGRRALGALSALFAVVPLTACSGGGSPEGAAAAPSATASAPATPSAPPPVPAGPPMTIDLLFKRALAAGEVPGYRIDEFGVEAVGHQRGGRSYNERVDEYGATGLRRDAKPVADNAACQPLADAMTVAPVGHWYGSVQRLALREPVGAAGPRSGIVLSSYEGRGAEAAMDAFRDAAARCAGGFTSWFEGERDQIRSVTAVPVQAGDEAFGVAVAGDVGGSRTGAGLVAVRRGGTVFTVVTLGSDSPAQPPKALIEAQVKKLG